LAKIPTTPVRCLGGLYSNTATITDGPCVAGDCDNTSVVPVWRVAFDRANNATEPLLEGAEPGQQVVPES
jgi:hypothetical protein